MNQEWFCDSCGKAGSVRCEEHGGVMHVVQKIEDAHREVSPGCERDVRDIRAVARGR